MLNYSSAALSYGSDKNLQGYFQNSSVHIGKAELFESEGSLGDGLISAVAENVGTASCAAMQSTMKALSGIIQDRKDSFEHRRNAMFDAIVLANDTVHEQSDGGCAIAAASIKGDRLTVTNLGDAAVYLVHDSSAMMLTDSHSRFVNVNGKLEKVRTRYIGSADNKDLDLPVYDDEKLAEGDVVLICTGDIVGALGESRISRILTMPLSLSDRMDKLASAAIESDPEICAYSIMLIEIHRGPNSELGRVFGVRLPEHRDNPVIAIVLIVVFIAAAIVITVIANNNSHSTAVPPNEQPTISPDFDWNPVATPIPSTTSDVSVTNDPSNPIARVTEQPSNTAGSAEKITATPGSSPTPTPMPSNPSTPTPVPSNPPTPMPVPTPNPWGQTTPTPEPDEPPKPTEAPVITDVPETIEPETQEPETSTPEPIESETPIPETPAPETPAPEPETQIPETEAPATPESGGED